MSGRPSNCGNENCLAQRAFVIVQQSMTPGNSLECLHRFRRNTAVAILRQVAIEFKNFPLTIAIGPQATGETFVTVARPGVATDPLEIERLGWLGLFKSVMVGVDAGRAGFLLGGNDSFPFAMAIACPPGALIEAAADRTDTSSGLGPSMERVFRAILVAASRSNRLATMETECLVPRVVGNISLALGIATGDLGDPSTDIDLLEFRQIQETSVHMEASRVRLTSIGVMEAFQKREVGDSMTLLAVADLELAR